jgi:hypothetical protein
MQTINKHTILWAAGSFVLIALFFLSSGFTSTSTTPPAKYFVVSENGKTISSEKKQKLTQAYKAIYGKSAKLKAVELVKYNGKMWVALQSGGQASPTLAIELKKQETGLTFGLESATNTCAGDGCSWCYFMPGEGCICNRGEGSCIHTTSSLKSLDKIAEPLGLY